MTQISFTGDHFDFLATPHGFTSKLMKHFKMAGAKRFVEVQARALFCERQQARVCLFLGGPPKMAQRFSFWSSFKPTNTGYHLRGNKKTTEAGRHLLSGSASRLHPEAIEAQLRPGGPRPAVAALHHASATAVQLCVPKIFSCSVPVPSKGNGRMTLIPAKVKL